MKSNVLLVGLIFHASFAGADPLNDPERRMDKYAHFGVSATITAAFQTIVKGFHRQHRISDENRSASSTLAFAIGALKEYRDFNAGATREECRSDLVADAMGVAFGNLIHWEF